MPLALGVLASLKEIPYDKLEDSVFIGELGLDGRLKPVRGALSVAVEAKAKGRKRLLLPVDNAAEAAVVDGLEVIPLTDLGEAVAWTKGEVEIAPHVVDIDALFEREENYEFDMADVKGQEHVKRALEVGAAGGHNLLMLGPPGSGKTLLARCLPTILPRLSLDEAIEITKIYSVAGRLSREKALVATRPFRSPHHTVSNAGLIGGGGMPKPGEVSLAHLGLLFLDELPEFGKSVLEVLRQPLEDGHVTISRAAMSLTYPARGMLAAAMNPCPCGHRGDTRKACVCDPHQIERYLGRLSGPLLDRIDLHIEVPALAYDEMARHKPAEASVKVRQRVDIAREIQTRRFKDLPGVFNNAQMGPRHLRQWCRLDEAGQALLKTAVDRLGLSARAHDRVLKVARSVADLEGSEEISISHLGEAIQYRSLDRGREELVA